jgi:hypothetical protein
MPRTRKYLPLLHRFSAWPPEISRWRWALPRRQLHSILRLGSARRSGGGEDAADEGHHGWRLRPQLVVDPQQELIVVALTNTALEGIIGSSPSTSATLSTVAEFAATPAAFQMDQPFGVTNSSTGVFGVDGMQPGRGVQRLLRAAAGLGTYAIAPTWPP